MYTPDNVSGLVREYQSVVNELSANDLGSLEKHLVNDAEWTDRGAKELIYLANHYGSFVLRNALALSIVLGIEDGNSGL
jgi:hypothetical protein